MNTSDDLVCGAKCGSRPSQRMTHDYDSNRWWRDLRHNGGSESGPPE